MQIDIPLQCPSCDGKMYSVSYESVCFILKKRSGKYAKNATLREIQKNSKNPFVAHETIFNFSKQFLIQIK